MSALFTLPRQVPLSACAILPGAKLYFTQTLTTTPQNTYTTDARSVAHSNPVVADSNGVFAPIYLDPTLPAYRVRLTTSADVLVYQEDGVPSNQNTQQSIRLLSTSPNILFFDTDGSINERKYRFIASGDEFLIQQSNDNENIFTTVMTVEDGSVSLAQGSTIIDGSANAYSIAGTDSGSFTGTLTGLTTTPTALVVYRRAGSLVLLQYAAQSATSNATSLTITGMPQLIFPNSTSPPALVSVTDNGTTQLGTVSVTSLGVITFKLGASSGNFTNSGTKGFPTGLFVYSLS